MVKNLCLASVIIFGGFLAGLFLSRLADNCSTSPHYSYFSTPDFFDTAYEQAALTEADPKVRGIIVNHHLLAGNLIAETISQMATDKPVSVILISPNHFAVGNGQIITSIADWETPYGVLASNCRLAKQLQAQGVLNIDERPFAKEHGISGLVAFVKKSLPNATILPIIIKDTASDQEIDKLASVIDSQNILVIGSFDFSHETTNQVAREWDKESLRAITGFDYKLVHNIHIDSRPGLRLVLKLMESAGAKNFTLTANTNSAQILGNLNLTETTSYIDGIFRP